MLVYSIYCQLFDLRSLLFSNYEKIVTMYIIYSIVYWPIQTACVSVRGYDIYSLRQICSFG